MRKRKAPALPVDTAPAVPVCPVPPPANLSKLARESWLRVIPELFTSGRLETTDLFAFELLCESYAQYLQAKQSIEERGQVTQMTTTVTNADGTVTKRSRTQVHPLLGVMREMAETVRSLCRELGMTPSARRLMQSVGTAKATVDAIQEMTPDQIEEEISRVDEEIGRLPIGERSRRLSSFNARQKRLGRADKDNPDSFHHDDMPKEPPRDLADSSEITPDEESDWIEDESTDDGADVPVDGK